MRSALLEIQGVRTSTSMTGGSADAQVDRADTARAGYARCPEQYAPDRIIIESSGSAFPATLAWQVRQLEEEGLLLDAVVSASSRSSAPCSCALICTFALATLFHDADCNACSGCLAPPQL